MASDGAEGLRDVRDARDLGVFIDPQNVMRAQVTPAQKNLDILMSVAEAVKIAVVNGLRSDGLEAPCVINLGTSVPDFGDRLPLRAGPELQLIDELLRELKVFDRAEELNCDHGSLIERAISECQVNAAKVYAALTPHFERIAEAAFIAPLPEVSPLRAPVRPNVDVVVITGQSSLLPWWDTVMKVYFERHGRKVEHVKTMASAWESKLAVAQGAQSYYEARNDPSRRVRYQMVGRLLERTRLPVITSDGAVVIARMRPFYELSRYPGAAVALEVDGRLRVRVFTRNSISSQEVQSLGEEHRVRIFDDHDLVSTSAPPPMSDEMVAADPNEPDDPFSGSPDAMEQRNDYFLWVDSHHQLRGALFRGGDVAQPGVPAVVVNYVRLLEAVKARGDAPLSGDRTVIPQTTEYAVLPLQDLGDFLGGRWMKDPRGRFSFLIGFRINGQFIHGIRISRAQLEGERGVTVGQIDLLTKYLQAAKGHEPPILAVYFTASSDESTTIVAPGDTLRDPGVCDCWVVTADPRGRPVAYQRTPQARWTRWEIEQPAEDHTHTFDNYVRRVGELDLEKA